MKSQSIIFKEGADKVIDNFINNLTDDFEMKRLFQKAQVKVCDYFEMTYGVFLFKLCWNWE